MTEIDALEGEELAETVASAQGWTVNSDGIWCDSDKEMTQYDCSARSPDYYCPHCNIAQAWELVEWITAKERRADFYLSREDDGSWSVVIHDLQWRHEDNYYKVTVDVYNQPTAPVAICRAFLKAKAAQ